MQIMTVGSGYSRTLRIRADKSLDCSIHSVFSQAAILADYPWIDNIEIDLGKTRIIRDSGLSMLSMLSAKLGLQKGRIKLINCRPEIRTRLHKSTLAEHLSVG